MWPSRGALAATASIAAAAVLLGTATSATAQSSATSPWSPVATPADAASPPPSMSHAAGALRNGTSLVVFGGCTSSCCFAPIDQLWELRLNPDASLAAGSWRQLTTTNPDNDNNNRPGPRFSAATTVDSRADALYMFGGQDSSQAFLNELWRLELVDDSTARWTRLRTPFLHTPPPRGAASLSLLGSGRHLLAFGGFGRDGARNDAWALDLSDARSGWRRLAVKGAGGMEPPHRWHHTAVVVGPRTVVIVGGSDETGQDVGDAWTLEVDFREGTAVWSPLVEEAGIPPRHGHAALRAETKGGQQLGSFVVFGGTNTTANTLPESFLGDAYRLDVAAAKWAPVEGGDEQEEAAASRPGVRAYAAVGHGPGHSVVFGGFAGYTGDLDDRLLGDVWVFRHGVGLEMEEVVASE